ncbi:paraneoplastic antigen Ma2 homolog [Rana temporaria]|uniref:paraneoplastic antigen Ma2 homolog n=1 Tax=Rana temporaria TaxID=8407 RepID=UPI001AAC7BCD|nr:paraneoplastic antigen Ma2 homolog [Rana temporaria]
MDAAAATMWCIDEGVPVAKGLVIEVRGEAWDEEEVLLIMETLSPSQKLWVMNSRVDDTNPHTYALYKWADRVPDCLKKPSVKTTNGTEPFLIQPEQDSAVPSYSSAIPLTSPSTPAPMGAPGKTVKGAAKTPLKDINPELCAVLEEIVAQCKKDPPDCLITRYRKLRAFSGRYPVPSSEDGFEEWMDQVTQALKEWGIPENNKKQRIMESLRGPALEAIRNLKLSKDNCTAQDYLEVLQNVFGRIEDISELRCQLEHCFQKKGEKLSEFVSRLDKILHRMLLKKGIDPKAMDKTRFQQVVKGAQPMDPIVFQLRTQKGNGVLKYPDLIRIIRQEEDLQDQKNKYQATEAPARVCVVATEDSNPQVEFLKTQVSQLTETVAALSGQAEFSPYQPRRDRTEKPAYGPYNQHNKPRRLTFCLNCGGVGHTREVCPSLANTYKPVYQPAENFRGPR